MNRYIIAFTRKEDADYVREHLRNNFPGLYARFDCWCIEEMGEFWYANNQLIVVVSRKDENFEDKYSIPINALVHYNLYTPVAWLLWNIYSSVIVDKLPAVERSFILGLLMLSDETAA